MHTIWHGFSFRSLSSNHLINAMLLKKKKLSMHKHLTWHGCCLHTCYVISHGPPMPNRTNKINVSSKIWTENKSSVCKTIKYQTCSLASARWTRAHRSRTLWPLKIHAASHAKPHTAQFPTVEKILEIKNRTGRRKNQKKPNSFSSDSWRTFSASPRRACGTASTQTAHIWTVVQHGCRNCMPETRLVFKIETFSCSIQFWNAYVVRCAARHIRNKKISERVKMPTNGRFPFISSHRTIRIVSGTSACA